MALDGTLTKISSQDIADAEQLVIDLQGPSSYAVGGEDLLPALPFRCNLQIDTAEGKALDPANGYAKWDAATGTLKFYTALDVEQADTTDLSADTYRLSVLGR